MTKSKKPLVYIPANVIDYTGLPAHAIRHTFVKSLVEISKCTPLIIPALGRDFDLEEIKDHVDGIVLTGSPSNIAPSCYGEKQLFEDKWLDPARDATTLPLIQQVIKHDIPMLAICRGFQELNVATGGTLHQRVQEQPGMMDHRASPDISTQASYDLQAHTVRIEKGGLLEKMGLPAEFTVNTVHQQGINKLGQGLFVEARAPDGLIEAVSVPGKRFILGVQWHPEGDNHINPVSRKIFEEFGKVLRS